VLKKVVDGKEELVVQFNGGKKEREFQVEFTVNVKLGSSSSKANFGYNRMGSVSNKNTLA
jgi:hypothetical protein